jgi:hypothetical protein
MNIKELITGIMIIRILLHAIISFFEYVVQEARSA